MRFLCALMSLFLTAPAFGTDVLYVSVAGEKRIAIYQIDGKGRLTHVGDASTTGEPGALAIDPKGRYLYAALRSTGELAAFRVDPGTGKLTHLNTVPAGADPAQISVSPTGRFLLTAYYLAGKVSVHQIGDDGRLSDKPRQVYKTRDKAHAVVVDPWERAVLIPHTGPNVIYALRWNEQTGELHKSFIGEEFFEAPQSTAPRHLVFHPTLLLNGGADLQTQVAYVANEQGSSVTLYHAILNPINWTIRPKQTLSTVPQDFKGTNTCAEIKLHPSNRFLYVSNRGHDSIARFHVNQETGELTSLGQTATEKTPRSFDLDPSGTFLFAAGEASGKLAAYRVDKGSGALDRIATYSVGRTPWWVMAVRLPLTEAEAIRLAEQFIVENGYTDLPAMKDKTKLSHESIDYADPDERLKLRFNSLERKAYGVGKVDLRKDGWTIVFRYNANNNRNGELDYDQYVKTVGRALTMKADGSDIRMIHQDFYLTNVKVIRSGDK